MSKISASIAVARILDTEILIGDDVWLSSSGIPYGFKGSTFMQLTGYKMERDLWDKLALVQSSEDPMPITVSIGSNSEDAFVESLRLSATLTGGRWTRNGVTVLLGEPRSFVTPAYDREFWELNFVV